MLTKFITGLAILLLPLFVSAQYATEQFIQSYYQKPMIKSMVAPTILTAIGLFTLKESGFLNKHDIQEFLHDNIGKTHTNLDDYLAFTPMVSVTGLNWSGVKPKNDFYNRTLLLIKSELVMLGIVYGLKYTTNEMRPDSSDNLSFPSGHTAQAFLSATLMHKEFKDRSIWYSVAGYTTASAVGLLRIMNNKHWAPDVLVGAAAGILSVNMVYFTHRTRVFHRRLNTACIYPYSVGKYTGLGVIWDL